MNPALPPHLSLNLNLAQGTSFKRSFEEFGIVDQDNEDNNGDDVSHGHNDGEEERRKRARQDNGSRAHNLSRRSSSGNRLRNNSNHRANDYYSFNHGASSSSTSRSGSSSSAGGSSFSSLSSLGESSRTTNTITRGSQAPPLVLPPLNFSASPFDSSSEDDEEQENQEVILPIPAPTRMMIPPRIPTPNLDSTPLELERTSSDETSSVYYTPPNLPPLDLEPASATLTAIHTIPTSNIDATTTARDAGSHEVRPEAEASDADEEEDDDAQSSTRPSPEQRRSEVEQRFRLTLERFNAFEEEIDILRRSPTEAGPTGSVSLPPSLQLNLPLSTPSTPQIPQAPLLPEIVPSPPIDDLPTIPLMEDIPLTHPLPIVLPEIEAEPTPDEDDEAEPRSEAESSGPQSASVTPPFDEGLAQSADDILSDYRYALQLAIAEEGQLPTAPQPSVGGAGSSASQDHHEEDSDSEAEFFPNLAAVDELDIEMGLGAGPQPVTQNDQPAAAEAEDWVITSREELDDDSGEQALERARIVLDPTSIVDDDEVDGPPYSVVDPPRHTQGRMPVPQPQQRPSPAEPRRSNTFERQMRHAMRSAAGRATRESGPQQSGNQPTTSQPMGGSRPQPSRHQPTTSQPTASGSQQSRNQPTRSGLPLNLPDVSDQQFENFLQGFLGDLPGSAAIIQDIRSRGVTSGTRTSGTAGAGGSGSSAGPSSSRTQGPPRLPLAGGTTSQRNRGSEDDDLWAQVNELGRAIQNLDQQLDRQEEIARQRRQEQWQSERDLRNLRLRLPSMQGPLVSPMPSPGGLLTSRNEPAADSLADVYVQRRQSQPGAGQPDLWRTAASPISRELLTEIYGPRHQSQSRADPNPTGEDSQAGIFLWRPNLPQRSAGESHITFASTTTTSTTNPGESHTHIPIRTSANTVRWAQMPAGSDQQGQPSGSTPGATSTAASTSTVRGNTVTTETERSGPQEVTPTAPRGTDTPNTRPNQAQAQPSTGTYAPRRPPNPPRAVSSSSPFFDIRSPPVQPRPANRITSAPSTRPTPTTTTTAAVPEPSASASTSTATASTSATATNATAPQSRPQLTPAELRVRAALQRFPNRSRPPLRVSDLEVDSDSDSPNTNMSTAMTRTLAQSPDGTYGFASPSSWWYGPSEVAISPRSPTGPALTAPGRRERMEAGVSSSWEFLYGSRTSSRPGQTRRAPSPPSRSQNGASQSRRPWEPVYVPASATQRRTSQFVPASQTIAASPHPPTTQPRNLNAPSPTTAQTPTLPTLRVPEYVRRRMENAVPTPIPAPASAAALSRSNSQHGTADAMDVDDVDEYRMVVDRAFEGVGESVQAQEDEEMEIDSEETDLLETTSRPSPFGLFAGLGATQRAQGIATGTPNGNPPRVPAPPPVPHRFGSSLFGSNRGPTVSSGVRRPHRRPIGDWLDAAETSPDDDTAGPASQSAEPSSHSALPNPPSAHMHLLEESLAQGRDLERGLRVLEEAQAAAQSLSQAASDLVRQHFGDQTEGGNTRPPQAREERDSLGLPRIPLSPLDIPTMDSSQPASGGINPESYAPGPFRNTIQRMADARRRGQGGVRTDAAAEVHRARDSIPTLPPLGFESDDPHPSIPRISPPPLPRLFRYPSPPPFDDSEGESYLPRRPRRGNANNDASELHGVLSRRRNAQERVYTPIEMEDSDDDSDDWHSTYIGMLDADDRRAARRNLRVEEDDDDDEVDITRAGLAPNPFARQTRPRLQPPPGRYLPASDTWPSQLQQDRGEAGFQSWRTTHQRILRQRAGMFGDYMRDEDLDMSYENLLSLSASIGDARPRGVSDQVVDSFESSTYQGWSTPDSDKRCPICLDDYKPDDKVLKLDDCIHWLHDKCLREWLKGAKTCPVCRKAVASASRRRRSDQPPANPTASSSTANPPLTNINDFQPGRLPRLNIRRSSHRRGPVRVNVEVSSSTTQEQGPLRVNVQVGSTPQGQGPSQGALAHGQPQQQPQQQQGVQTPQQQAARRHLHLVHHHHHHHHPHNPHNPQNPPNPRGPRPN